MGLYSEQRVDQLIDECTKTALQQIIGPFGLSVAMFDDRDGGAVDTTHNAREGFMSDELKADYEKRGEYDAQKSREVHSAKAYIERNRELGRQKENGEGINAYSNKRISRNAKTDLDHVMAAKEVHDDRARVLAEIDTADLANLEENLQLTLQHTNRSMKQMPIDEYIEKLEREKPQRQARIKELEGKKDLTDKERKQLENLKEEEDFDPEIARKLDKQARKAIEKAEDKAYYKFIKKDKNGKIHLSKFAKNQLKAGGKEAARNAIRAALGELLVVLVNQTFLEVKAFIKERKQATGNVFVEIQNRLKRVVAKVLAKLKQWEENVKNMAEGFISGFCSSLVTTLINVFAMTAKRFVRAIREGIFSIIKAFNILFFRPMEMTEEEAMKTVIKLLSGVAVTTLGIAAENAINTFIQSVPLVGQFASIITPAVMGMLTGVAIALISYYVDMVFHFAKMREETFKELLNAGKLQGVYAELLTKTGEGFVSMGEAYERMIETNAEVLYSLDEVEVSGARILRAYSSVNMTGLEVSRGNEILQRVMSATSSVRIGLADEMVATRAWAASRKKA